MTIQKTGVLHTMKMSNIINILSYEVTLIIPIEKRVLLKYKKSNII